MLKVLRRHCATSALFSVRLTLQSDFSRPPTEPFFKFLFTTLIVDEFKQIFTKIFAIGIFKKVMISIIYVSPLQTSSKRRQCSEIFIINILSRFSKHTLQESRWTRRLIPQNEDLFEKSQGKVSQFSSGYFVVRCIFYENGRRTTPLYQFGR